ncbi:Elongin-C [Neolecta irregularis DAH-3]|uniref:Elongin-C n=1 Tax=Neolecta irregularis (strain DAH-3) TaxID=1198029 RepID=A0A1U7LRS8_NEOID|nr:Elongin-C [Neolecta irregularis DAH-3]|eukprot:OLL25376.1 Elongin-C [Neolecta irregularis DAH-3]
MELSFKRPPYNIVMSLEKTQNEDGPKYVRLVSSDNHTFIIERSAAMVSGTLKGMLASGNFVEGDQNVATLNNIRAELLEKVCDYLYYHVKYKEHVERPDFDIPPHMALELLVAADFLDSTVPDYT